MNFIENHKTTLTNVRYQNFQNTHQLSHFSLPRFLLE